MKALKEGRVPQPGPPIKDEVALSAPMTPDAEPTAPPIEVATHRKDDGQTPITKMAAGMLPEPAEDDQGPVYDEHLAKLVHQAQKHAKFAQSALVYEDIPTAIDNLEKALAILRPLNNESQ